MNDDRLTLGYVAGAHGIRGAVKVRLHDPASEALHAGTVITLVREGAPVATVEIDHVAGGRSGELLVQLHGVSDRDAADALRGCEVRIDRAELPPLADDEYYLADLVGAIVERAEPGGGREPIGVVVGVTSNGVQDLLEVEWSDHDGTRHAWLLPALPGFVLDVQIDDRGARVLADVPPGFLPDPLEREDT